MSQNTDSNPVSQELPLLERSKHGWEVRKQLCPKVKQPSKIYTTKEVVKLLRIPSDRPIRRARSLGSAYLHNPGDLKDSRIVVAVGQKNKWLVYSPFGA